LSDQAIAPRLFRSESTIPKHTISMFGEQRRSGAVEYVRNALTYYTWRGRCRALHLTVQ
jgi:hypothetical protein